MQDKMIATLRNQLKKNYNEDSKKQEYSPFFKKHFLKVHYRTGISLLKIEKLVGIPSRVSYGWKREFGKDQTGFIYGHTVRNDVRTKALAVQEYIENKVQVKDLSNKYNVKAQTIYQWISIFKDNYKDWLNIPDGVATIINEDKLVYGSKNIQFVMQKLQDKNIDLKEILDKMHQYGISKEIIKEIENIKQETEKNYQTLNDAQNIIKSIKEK